MGKGECGCQQLRKDPRSSFRPQSLRKLPAAQQDHHGHARKYECMECSRQWEWRLGDGWRPGWTIANGVGLTA